MMKEGAATGEPARRRGESAMGDHDWAGDPQLQPPFEVVEPRGLDHAAGVQFAAFRARATRAAFSLCRGSTRWRCAARRTLSSTNCSCPASASARRCCARISLAPFSTSIASPTSSTRRCSTARCPSSPTRARCGSPRASASIPRVVGDAQPIYRGHPRRRRAGADRGLPPPLSRAARRPHRARRGRDSGSPS